MKTILNILIFLAVFAVAGEVQAATLAKPANNLGLVGYWSFNEGASTLAGDYSGSGKNGTFTGNPTWVDGKFGKALDFNGTTDYVSVTSLPASSFTNRDFTWSAWVKGTELGSPINMPIIGSGSGSWFRIGFIQTSSVWRFAQYFDGTNNTNVTCGPAVSSTEWVHLVAVADHGGNVTCYQNGVAGTPAAYTNDVTSSQGFGIGYALGSHVPWGNLFDGAIDEVRVYNRTLSAAEVAALYRGSGNARAASSNTVGLVGYWNFNEGVGTIVRDASGHGGSGELLGTTPPVWVDGPFGKALDFDGSTSYVQLSTVENVRAVALWVYIESGQTGFNYLLDARNGLANGWFSQPNSSIGSNWVRMYVNGESVSVAGASIPTDEWAHVYLESNTVFADDINLMSRFSDAETLAGQMDEVRLYNRSLSAAEIAALADSSPPSSTSFTRLNTSSINLTQGTSLASGLVGHWTFDGADTGTTIADKSGQGNDGYFLGGATSSAKAVGKLGQSFFFGGQTRRVAVGTDPSINSLDDFTLAGWVKLTAYGTYSVMMSNIPDCCSGSANGYGLWAARYGGNPGISIYKDGSLTNFVSSPKISLNEWHHIVGTYDGAEVNVYVNGVNTQTSSYSAWDGVDATNDMRLGGISPSGGHGLNSGYLDDLRIYNRALTADEVEQLYNLGR